MNSQLLIEKIQQKIKQEMMRLPGGIPYIPENGHYQDLATSDISWWTNGFFAGIMWQLFNVTKDKEYQDNAGKIENSLDYALFNFEEIHHDVGFMWLHTAVADYKLTGNEMSRKRGLHAATILAGRFNPKGKFIKSWNHQDGWVIIDSMMNIPLLLWASEETGDPRFKEIALLHAETVATYLCHDDGSVGHIISFDPVTGEFIGDVQGQGYSPTSAWSRGQGWAIYGFAILARHTEDIRYLNIAKRVANYFITNVSQTGYIPHVDFKAPTEPECFDTSAGMIATCGMLEIADQTDAIEGRIYKLNAEKILTSTIAQYADWNTETDGIIGGGTVAYHREIEQNVPIVYTDYFFIEAVLRLVNKNTQLW